MSGLPSPTFPRVLRNLWSLTDPASRSSRRCDALDIPTDHQRLDTYRGAYWVCAQTGQMHREADAATADAAKYDVTWEQNLGRPVTDRDRAECARWVRAVAPYRTTGKLLEVGSGAGVLLAAMKDAGWAATGNEYSPLAGKYAQERSGVPVIVGPIEEVDLPAGEFDVVLCNNVFEHLAQPRAVLIKLARAMRPGGVMFLQTLNGECWSLRSQPTRWVYYGYGHLFIPTLISMHHYFAAAGLRLKSLETHGYHSRPTPDDAPRMRDNKGPFDKLIANVAGPLKRGHRVKCLLERPGISQKP